MTQSEETIQVGIAGLGTVGRHVALRLDRRRGDHRRRSGRDISLEAVADPIERPDLENKLEDTTVYRDAERMIDESDIDIFVELIGGIQPPKSLILEAIDSGLDVVTANKELLAKEGQEIFPRAEEEGQAIRFESSVGGSIPVIRTVREAFIDVDFNAIHGIINGTANYVLTKMSEDGQAFESALETAQEKGFAESDPSYDIEGDDSAHKLSLLATVAHGQQIAFEDVHCEGITDITPEIINDAQELGYRIKLLGIAKDLGSGLDLRVHPTLIPEDSGLAAVSHQYNAIFIQGEPIGSSMLSGKGAGGASTATAVVGDVFSIAKNGKDSGSIYYSDDDRTLISTEEIKTRYYLRVQAEDRPGVLSEITEILGDLNISINSLLQRGKSKEEKVPIVLTTHQAVEGDLRKAVRRIEKLDVIGDEPLWLRIEDDL